MQVITNKEKLYINQVIGEKNDIAIIEEDFVVPDIKPDILNSINTNGTVCVYKKEIIDGKIKIDGCINTYIMYLADDDNNRIRGINTNINFTKVIDCEFAKEGMMFENIIKLKTIECKVLNGRKISIKAIMDINVKVLSNEEVNFINEINNLNDIQVLNDSVNINALIGTGKTRTYAKDTILFDTIDNLLEILNVDVKLLNKEVKISYNKALIKAETCLKIMYLTEDGRICSKNQIIPIMGFVDIQDISDDDMCDINFEISNMVIKPNNMEEHSVYVEIEYDITCNVFKKKEINVIEDLYSPSVSVTYKPKQINTIIEKNLIKDILSIKENRDIPEIGNNKIYNVKVDPIINKRTILKDQLLLEGELNLNFLYEIDSGKNIGTKTINIPFNYTMKCLGVSEKSQIDLNMEVILQDFTIINENNIEIKIELEFAVNMINTKSINVIDEINIEETRSDNKSSLTIYYVKEGDKLWNIAKKFNSTVKNIMEVNELENESKLKIGEQLFIPISI